MHQYPQSGIELVYFLQYTHPNAKIKVGTMKRKLPVVKVQRIWQFRDVSSHIAQSFVVFFLPFAALFGQKRSIQNYRYHFLIQFGYSRHFVFEQWDSASIPHFVSSPLILHALLSEFLQPWLLRRAFEGEKILQNEKRKNELLVPEAPHVTPVSNGSHNSCR